MSKIEKAAVRYFSELIDDCPFLDSSIDFEDKRPTIDGEVRIYSKLQNKSGQFSKKDFLGRVDVQVKGTKVREVSSLTSFPLEIDALKAARNNGGVLFVVVAITEESASVRKGYFAYLFEREIDAILRKTSSGQKKKSIRLTELPSSPEALQSVITYAATLQQTSLFVDVDGLKVDGLNKWKVISDRDLDLSEPKWYGIGGEPALIEAMADTGQYLPTNLQIRIIPENYMPQPIGMDISAGDVRFVDSHRRRISLQRSEIAISPAIKLLFNISSNKVDISYQPSKNLYDYYRELLFMLNWGTSG